MKRLETLALLAGIALLGHAALGHADEVSITLTTDVTGSSGNALTVFGDLTNSTTSTQYFGSDAINLTAPPTVATASDDLILNGLFGLGPTSIAAGTTLDNVDLFSVQFLGGSGTYTGNTFQLFGGTDAVGCADGSPDCTTLLGTGGFQLTVAPTVPSVPEPSTGWLLLSGIGLIGLWRRRREITNGA